MLTPLGFFQFAYLHSKMVATPICLSSSEAGHAWRGSTRNICYTLNIITLLSVSLIPCMLLCVIQLVDMPHLDEPYYCSQQINIPPELPDILKQFTKAAIRTQPKDVLAWSAAWVHANHYYKTDFGFTCTQRRDHCVQHNSLLLHPHIQL